MAVLTAAGIVLLAYATEPFVPLAGAGAIVAAAIALTRPIAAVCVALALVPLELFSIQLGDAGLSPAETMFAVTGFAWAGRRIAEGELPIVSSPLTKPLALLVIAVLPGLAVASESFAVAKTLVMWTSFFLVYLAVVAEASATAVRRILLVLALSGAVVGLVAAFESGGGAGTPSLGQLGLEAENRAEGSFDDPNILATFLALALPAALALGLHRRGRTALLGLAAFAAILAGLALSLSRGGLLAVAAALAVMTVWRPFRRMAVAVGVVVVGFAVAGANPFGDVQQIDTVTQRVSSIGYSAQGVDPRFSIWETTPEIIAEHPLFGVGANNFAEVAPSYGLLGPTSKPYAHAHNIPLTVGAELGLLGLVALIWASVKLVTLLVRTYSRTEGETRGLVVAVGAALTAVALQGTVDYTIQANVLAAATITVVGCAVALSRTAGAAGQRP